MLSTSCCSTAKTAVACCSLQLAAVRCWGVSVIVHGCLLGVPDAPGVPGAPPLAEIAEFGGKIADGRLIACMTEATAVMRGSTARNGSVWLHQAT